MKLEDFLSPKVFLFRIYHLAHYLKTFRLPPGYSDALVPGELEWRTQGQRTREGIPMDFLTWKQIEEVKRRLGPA